MYINTKPKLSQILIKEIAFRREENTILNSTCPKILKASRFSCFLPPVISPWILID